MNEGPCLETFGVTPPPCLCLLPRGHDGPHVCHVDGAAWDLEAEPMVRWPGPGGQEARRARLKSLAARAAEGPDR